ncbi:aggregation-promoting factor C-terminal-like domain-containing protein [Streptosporangium soli]|nr:lytic transglycosylase domain-containing protein [Streptosporangium sp. KLBMP 9127]
MPTPRRTGASLVAAAVIAAGASTAGAAVAHADGSVTTAAESGATEQAKKTVKRSTENKRIARPLAAKKGWKAAQFRCLSRLWHRESGWNHRAHNGYSGAYGIPQAMPGRKMSGAGKDWRTNPRTQIKWGLKYIAQRYDTPCGAWAHFRSRGWY